MNIIALLICLATILETYRLTIYYLRKDISITKKVTESSVLILLIFLSYLELNSQTNDINYLSLTFILYVFIMFIIDIYNKNNYISTLSVKNSIDMSSMGILFLNKDIPFLMNNSMKDILNTLKIKDNYLNNLINKSFKKINNFYLLKINDNIYELKIISSHEIHLLNITEEYLLESKMEIKNQEIESNNQKILETIKNIEKLEKTKHLLKLKNEYHDILGHRLALLSNYLDQGKNNPNDLKFLLNTIFNDINSLSPIDKLNNLIKLYYLTGININIEGNVPKDNNLSNLFFEIIREAVTNAIIHAESKNIDIKIINKLNKITMTITNDGKKPNHIIYENEGIKGMRRKLSEFNGNLDIDTKELFTLKITI